MSFLDNLALKYKLIIPLAVMVAVFAGVLVNAINSIVDQRQETEQIIEHVDPAMVLLTRANLDMQGMGYDLYRILSYPDNSSQSQAVVAAYPSLADKGTQRFNEAEAADPDDMAQIDAFKARYTALLAEMAPLEQQAQAVTGFTIGSKATPAETDATAAVARQIMPVDADIDAFYTDLHQYIDTRQAANLAATTALAAKTQSEIWSMIIVGVAAMIGGVGLFLWIISTRVVSPLLGVSKAMSGLASGKLDTVVRGDKRRDEVGHMARAVLVFKENAVKTQALEQEAEAARKRQDEERVRQEAMRAEQQRQQEQVVNDLADGLSKLSRGDLLTRLDTPFSADYERLRGDFNAAMDRLQDAMRFIAGSTHSVSAGANEISAASDDLSQRTERQAANLEETAAALDQITAAVKKTAENSDGARQAVAGAKNDAESSGAVMRSAVEAMTGIEQSTREISNILSVIDEIAFQTNLLALNAGVEAARAGDAGRGFAVVATEVRALAQRSADAAKEIKTLIVNSNKQVDAGVKLVGETGAALTRIAEQVTTLNNLIGDIAASAKEQSSGLEQVNTAVNQMDQVTQQNAAMVEQATAASRGLLDDAQELSKLVGQFQIGALATAARETKPAHKPVPKPAPKAVSRPKTASRQAALQSAGGDGDWDEF